MKYFSIPADFEKHTLDKLAELNNKYDDSKIIELYGNITVNNVLGSGRTIKNLPKIDLYDLAEYVSYSKSKGIDFNYTLNATHLNNFEYSQQGISNIKSFICSLYDIGVRSITVALPSIIELINSLNIDMKVKASTLCQITNPNKALAFKKLNVYRIVADESINRDFYMLRNIRKVFGEQVEVIVNPICHKNCMYRMFHYNQISSDSIQNTNDVSTNYFEHRCILQRLDQIGNLMKMAWIRPEDLNYYTSIGINYFKLQGRHAFNRGGDIVKALKHYIEGDFEGNLIDILNIFGELNNFNIELDNKKLDGFLEKFYANDHFCNNNCSMCNYCELFVTKISDINKAKEIKNAAGKFYNDYDQFNNLLKQQPESIVPKQDLFDDISFDCED